jgi:hypothetical protein
VGALRYCAAARSVVAQLSTAAPRVHAGNDNFEIVRSGTATRLAGLVSLMRGEATCNHLGGRAMLNALSTAMFA